MLWLLVYCVWSVLFFFVGAKALSLHWFANGFLALLAAGTLTLSTCYVARSRLCPGRVTRAIKGQKKPSDIQSIIEGAFGETPFNGPSGSAIGVVFLALPPLTILLYLGWGFLLQSTFWRSVLAFGLGVPLASLVSVLVEQLAGQNRVMTRVRQMITEHSPEAWKEMERKWNGTLRFLDGWARLDVGTHRPEVYALLHRAPPSEWHEVTIDGVKYRLEFWWQGGQSYWGMFDGYGGEVLKHKGIGQVSPAEVLVSLQRKTGTGKTELPTSKPTVS